jgi:hypothetical protein
MARQKILETFFTRKNKIYFIFFLDGEKFKKKKEGLTNNPSGSAIKEI